VFCLDCSNNSVIGTFKASAILPNVLIVGFLYSSNRILDISNNFRLIKNQKKTLRYPVALQKKSP